MPQPPNQGLLPTAVLSLLALVGAVVGFALLVGAGAVRQGPPLLVVAGALALLILPALGLSRPLQGRREGLPLGFLLWSGALLVGYPLYFPQERGAALAVGASVLLRPFGYEGGAALAGRVEQVLPTSMSTRPPPPAANVLVDSVVAPRDIQGDEVVLPYEGEGQTVSVPVTFSHQGRELDVWMLYDTGATLTTANSETLRKLGVRVPADAPTLNVRTAAGPRDTRLVLVDAVWIGGMEVQGVTVSVCDECADDATAGLLGLNVSGRFLTTMDTHRHELGLRPSQNIDRKLDVSPWLAVVATATRWEDGRIEVSVHATNSAARAVTRAGVAIRCEEAFQVELPAIASGASVTETVSLPHGTRCEGYSVSLTSAEW